MNTKHSAILFEIQTYVYVSSNNMKGGGGCRSRPAPQNLAAICCKQDCSQKKKQGLPDPGRFPITIEGHVISVLHNLGDTHFGLEA